MRLATCIVLFGLLTSIAFRAKADNSCAIMNRGAAAGQCIDTRSKRPAQIVVDSEDSFVFNNFYHAGKFWKATLKPNAVRRVFFQIEKFDSGVPGVVAAHTQLRFDMSSPLLLTSPKGGAPIRVSSFVVSYEYIAPKGVPYDVFKGALNEFNIVGRVVSLQTRSKEQAKDEVDNYQLRLPPNLASEVALRAIRKSEGMGILSPYNTVRPNCTTEVFAVFDNTLHYDHYVPTFSVVNAELFQFDPVAAGSLAALKDRGLL